MSSQMRSKHTKARSYYQVNASKGTKLQVSVRVYDGTAPSPSSELAQLAQDLGGQTTELSPEELSLRCNAKVWRGRFERADDPSPLSLFSTSSSFHAARKEWTSWHTREVTCPSRWPEAISIQVGTLK